MNVVGVDLQATGIAVGLWPSMETDFIKLPKYKKADTPQKRYKRLQVLATITQEYDVFTKGDVVYVERAYGANRNSQTVLMQLLGAFIGGLAEGGVRVEEINVSSWKATALGNGRASKEDVMAWASEQAGRDIATQDEADALAIAYAGFLREQGT